MTTDSILVIDEDPITRKMLRKFLQAEGYPVQTAENACENLETLTDLPNLVILDAHLSQQDAAQLIEHLHEHPLTPALVVMSTDSDSRRWALEVGASAFIPKPLSLPTLLKIVQTLCE